MSEALSAVLAQAMQLSVAERGELVDRLADTLDPPDEAEQMTDAEFATELLRRADDLRANPSAGVPWEQVREMR
jgi:putative addiction module component (TIGR02574 family)